MAWPLAREELAEQHGTLRVSAHRPRPVSQVNTADVLEILTPIWHVKAETASAVRQRIRSVLEWAISMDLRNDNPCDRVLPVLGPQNNIVTHRLALPHKDVAAAVETLRASGSTQPAVKLAIEFLVLPAARSAEVRLATWTEMDTAGGVWTVAAGRMKAKREHRVPLCGRALEADCSFDPPLARRARCRGHRRTHLGCRTSISAGSARLPESARGRTRGAGTRR